MAMFPAAMSNSTSLSEEASVSSCTLGGLNPVVSTFISQPPEKPKKKRSLPGNPDPDAEVIALSPKTLLATNRFVCEICNKGFQRDQNLQLHRRGHNLPWKLKQRNSKEVKKRAYVCPEPSCVHHNPSRALGDLTGIKKHYCRKHGEKKWKCEKCSKIYAVMSDWKAHTKTCGTREYRCDCGTLFSRKDSFITHRAFCDALAEESARLSANQIANTNPLVQSLFPFPNQQQNFQTNISLNPWDPPHQNPNPNTNTQNLAIPHIKPEVPNFQIPHLSSPPPFFRESQHQHPKGLINSPFQNLHLTTQPTSPHLSATALLQKAATVGATAITGSVTAAVAATATAGAVGQHVHQSVGHMTQLNTGEFGRLSQLDSVGQLSVQDYIRGFTSRDLATWQKSDHLTRDFLGLTADANGIGNDGGNMHMDGANVSVNMKDMLTFTGGAEYPPYDHHRHHPLLNLKTQQGFGLRFPETWGGDC
ncbi:Protein indeterminate-domain like [Quillaja saponaria]|uniref:Protein indeterminate-domain like n=1 Tax=Quillaja saponaria TaxID=32244 RepID=A0AAD7Q0Q5_QUISA|nr:Protein indeterminate-domain like [Quillaja saponaria]